LGSGENQPVFGPGHTDIKKTPGLLDLILDVLFQSLPSGQLLILDTHDVYPRELQPLGGMESE
jgi:hypothetical protein